MSEMVERVARAMAEAIIKQVRSGATFDETPCLMISDEDSNSFWELLPVVRAAIEAMREPTKRMLKIGNSVTTDGRDADDSWPAMIDAALK